MKNRKGKNRKKSKARRESLPKDRQTVEEKAELGKANASHLAKGNLSHRNRKKPGGAKQEKRTDHASAIKGNSMG